MYIFITYVYNIYAYIKQSFLDENSNHCAPLEITKVKNIGFVDDTICISLSPVGICVCIYQYYLTIILNLNSAKYWT